MDKNINVAFIPKKPLARSEVVRRRPIFSLTFLISLAVVLGAVGMSTMEYLNTKILEKEHASKKAELVKFEEGLIENKLLEEIRNLRVFSRQIDIAESLLEKHLAPTGLFAFVASTTPPEVQYQTFSYANSEEGINLVMKGYAKKEGLTGYEIVAALSQLYKADPAILDYSLTGLSLGEGEEESVSFTFTAVLDPILVSYMHIYGNGGGKEDREDENDDAVPGMIEEEFFNGEEE